jgi:tyrosyl-tRNA synthetase
MQEESVDQIFQ